MSGGAGMAQLSESFNVMLMKRQFLDLRHSESVSIVMVMCTMRGEGWVVGGKTM